MVTGGAGFIGSNFVHYTAQAHPDWSITVVDKLTYAGSLENVKEMEGRSGYRFVKGDICEREVVEPLVAEADLIVNFAAETHVDRSIHDAGQFILTGSHGFDLLAGITQSLAGRVLNPGILEALVPAQLFVDVGGGLVDGHGHRAGGGVGGLAGVNRPRGKTEVFWVTFHGRLLGFAAWVRWLRIR